MRSVLGLGLVVVLSIAVSAQLPTSTLNGTVSDPRGAVVSGAQVEITSNATGLNKETATGGDGGFAVADLAPGDYTVRVRASGFATSEFKEVRLDVGHASTLDVSLKIAKADEIVQVTGAELAVNTTQSEVQGLVRSEEMEALPLNGRNFLELAFLIPGNRPAPRFDPTKTVTLEVSSGGAYGRGGNIIVDGADNNDEVVGGTLMNFPEDGIGEFQIATNKYTAEVGRSESGIINIATKSGTNSVHGSEYMFFRHKALQGLPATFDRRQPTPRFAREQFGGSLGGPIVRDKLFGFFAGEYLNQDHAVPIGIREFNPDGTGLSPVPVGGSALAFVHDLRITSKGDWLPTAKDHIALRYSFQRSLDVDNGFQVRPFGSAANRQQSLNRYNSFLANWSRTISSNKVNTFIYQKNYFINFIPFFSPNDPLTNPAGLAAGNEVRFPDLQDGANYRIPQRTRLARDQFRDTFYWSAGKHSLNFGIEYQHYGSDIFFDLFGSGSLFMATDFPTNQFSGNGMPCSPTNPCTDLDIPIALALKSDAPGSPSGPFVHNNYLGMFVQDDWKVRPRLTLNLGLRWDIDFNSLGETDRDKACPSLTAIDPNNLNCEFIRNILGPHKGNGKYHNFGPRVGFAWDPFGKGKTVVRGGYGIYYDRVILEPAELEEVLNGRVLPLKAFNGSTIVGGVYAPDPSTGQIVNLANPFGGGPSTFGIGVNVIDNNSNTPYVEQFTLGVQHQLGTDFVLSVDGLHDRGYRQLVPRFLRSLPAGVDPTYIDCPNGRDPCTIIDPANGKTAAAGCFPPHGTPADPSCQQVTDFVSVGRTWYDALLVSFKKRPGSGPWRPGFNVSYTLSKTFYEQPDDQVSPSGGSTEDPNIVAMHFNNLKFEKGYSTGDERHRFVLSGNMEVPWKLNVSPIWTWASHVPMDSFVGASLNGGRLPNIPRNGLGRQIKDGAALYNAIVAYNALPPCGNPGPVPCNEGAVTPALSQADFQKIHFGDDFNSFDMRITRTFHLKEPHSLQAIAEVFNLFNITNIRGTTNRNYSGFSNTIDSTGFNRPLETAGKFFGSGGPRAFQFALRYTF
jgi:Carboxypeptidase regulatory-like domain/TonB dependent receptor